MIFSSITFLIFFTVLLLLLSVMRGQRVPQLLLLVASYVFYAAWDAHFCLLILASSLWSYAFGLALDRATVPTKRRLFLVLSLCADLGMLSYFKYANFFLDSFYALTGLEANAALNITLPVGISFFTFQTMSYSIDLYRRRIPVCKDVFQFSLFVAFFPQLVAGPIVRASEFLPQLNRPVRLTVANIHLGLQIFVLGMLQKTLVADNLSVYVDPVFANPTLYDSGTLWAALAAYGLQIFCDFSGYSLMAIGVGRVMGFELPVNFRTPYLACSITDFWRRWHISLSTWLRDYLYISLGGNRKGRFRADVNLMITMFLGGLWHGAGWTFVVWGVLHGAGLIVHKHWSARVHTNGWSALAQRLYKMAAFALTLVYVHLLWVLFRCTDFITALHYLRGLFVGLEGVHWLHTPSLGLIAVMALWHWLHFQRSGLVNLLPTQQPNRLLSLTLLGGAVLALLAFGSFDSNPFIYFQF